MNDVDALRDLLARTPPRPWKIDDRVGHQMKVVIAADGLMVAPIEEFHPVTAELIVTAVNALPALLNRLEFAERTP